MNSKERSPLEHNLLAAARILGAHQVAELTANHEYEVALSKKDGLAVILKEAEYMLAEADAVYSNAALTVLNLGRRSQALKDKWQAIYDATTSTRIRLWAIASSTNDDEIIEAAKQFGDATRAFWLHSQQGKELNAEIATAQELLKTASEARKAAVQKRGKAKAEFEAAEQEHNALARRRHESYCMFEMEKAVADAAAALTGTEEMQFAASYVYTKDLPIDLAGIVRVPAEVERD